MNWRSEAKMSEKLEAKAPDYAIVQKGGLTGYTRLTLRCCCCNKVFQKGSDYQNENIPFLLTIKPLCPSCAKHLKKWQEQREKIEKDLEGLRRKLREIYAKIKEKCDYELLNSQVDRESGYIVFKPQQNFNNFLFWLCEEFAGLVVSETEENCDLESEGEVKTK